MEARVTRLEDDMRDVRAILARLEPIIIRIDAAIPHLATRAELEAVRSEVKQGLASKPSITGMWMMGATLVALVVAAMATGAVYMPLMFRLMHMPPP